MTIWKAISAHPGYEVSDDGQVRSIDRIIERKNGIPMRSRGRLLSPTLDRDGYRSVMLDKRQRRKVAHLMLETFVGPRPFSAALARHLDDDNSNEVITNLAWGDKSDNAHDAMRNGLNWQTNKTHCKHDHEFTPENTYLHLGRHRCCRQCRQRVQRGRERATSSLSSVEVEA